MRKTVDELYSPEEKDCNCSTVVIGRGASATGYVLLGHNEDDARSIVQWHAVPAADHAPGETVSFDDKPYPIEQAEHTLAFYWSDVRRPDGISFGDSFFNEAGVAVVSDAANPCRDDPGETERSYLGYALRRLVGERATSAREGVLIAKALVEKYGYFGSRVYHIADRNECWSVQIPKGHRLAARRIPDDAVYFIPNWFTLHGIDFSDREGREYIFSEDIASHAEKMGWYKPAVPGDYSDFDFAAAYQKPSDKKGSCIVRERNAWPVLGFDDFEGKQFCAKARKIYGIEDVKALLRSHWEGRADCLCDAEYNVNPHQKGTSPFTLCGPCAVESTVTEFAEKPELTVVRRAWLQPCTNPYVPFFIGGMSVPASYHREDCAAAMLSHFAPPAEEFDYDPALAFWQTKNLVWQTEHDYAFCRPIIAEALAEYEEDEAQASAGIKKQAESLPGGEARELLAAYTLRKAEEAQKLVLRLTQKCGDSRHAKNVENQ